MFGVRIKVTQSDNHQVKAAGVVDDPFHVHAHFANCSWHWTFTSCGGNPFCVHAHFTNCSWHWTVTACEVRIGCQVYSPMSKCGDQEGSQVTLEERKETKGGMPFLLAQHLRTLTSFLFLPTNSTIVILVIANQPLHVHYRTHQVLSMLCFMHHCKGVLDKLILHGRREQVKVAN